MCTLKQRKGVKAVIFIFLFLSVFQYSNWTEKNKASQTWKPHFAYLKFSYKVHDSAIQYSFSVFPTVPGTQNTYVSSVLHLMTISIWKIQTNTLAVLSVKYMNKTSHMHFSFLTYLGPDFSSIVCLHFPSRNEPCLQCFLGLCQSCGTLKWVQKVTWF